MFNDDEKKELNDMLAGLIGPAIAAGFETEHERRRKVSLDVQATKANWVTRNYLVTVQDKTVCFPDERGRAINTNVFYARVKVDPEHPTFFAGEMSVLAWGDGRPLKEPITIILTGGLVSSMAQVSETFLEKAMAA
jgi:hypothetical protein